MLSAAQISFLVDEFSRVWPNTPRPRTTRGNENPWDASRYIIDLIYRLGSSPQHEATSEFELLKQHQREGYSEVILAAAAQQRKARRESAFKPVKLRGLLAAVTDAPPETARDLKAVVLDCLDVVQSKLRGSDTNPVSLFYSDSGEPRNENYCRDRVTELLEGVLPYGIERIPERAMPQGRADLAFRLGSLQLPVEAKGQWHRELWTAAESQLDEQYAIDWQAENQGIYLVFWFGQSVAQSKRVTPPPGDEATPETPAELHERLTAHISQARREDLSIYVLDLTRPD